MAGILRDLYCRDGVSDAAHAALRWDLFLEDVGNGVIAAIPVTERLLRRVEASTRGLPPSCHLRTLDALHRVTAADFGFTDIWTNDRHMLAAAPHFGLIGRSV
jgi:hypothetical protein